MLKKHKALWNLNASFSPKAMIPTITLPTRVPELLKLSLRQPIGPFCFSIDSDQNSSMDWGGWGSLYFWITKTDLTACAFERVCMICQMG